MSNDTNMTKLQKKLKKECPEFEEIVNGLSVEELEKRLMEYAKESEAVNVRLTELNEEGQPIYLAKQAVKELTAPFSDIKKVLSLKKSYLHFLIGEKGGDTGGSSISND